MARLIELEEGAAMAAYQEYIRRLETEKGWLEVDLVHNCFLMGEEVGELFKSIRNHNKLFVEGTPVSEGSKGAVAEEIVDVMNYLLAIANRMEIDVEAAFREKNERNQRRQWS